MKPNGDMREHARLLADLGFRVHPVKPGDKVPMLPDWPNAGTTDRGQIDYWWEVTPDANVGVLTGHDFVVIDIDGERGRDSMRRFEDRHGSLPVTYTVRTPRGGEHRYFLTRYAQQIRNKQGWLPGVDIRGNGGQVLAPGSVGSNGNRYEIIEGTDQFTELPDSVAALLTSGSASLSESPTDTDRDGFLSCAVPGRPPEGARVESVGDSVKLDDDRPRHDQVRDLAHHLRQNGVAQPVVLQCAFDRADRLGMLAERRHAEVVRLVDGAFSKPIEQDAPELSERWTRATGELLMHRPPVQWVAKDYATKNGLGMTAAEIKSGKTWITDHTLLCLATGRPVFGIYAVPRPVRVCLVQLEMPAEVFWSRFAASVLGAGLSLEEGRELIDSGQVAIFHKPLCDLTSKAGADLMIREVVDTGAEYVAIDNLLRAFCGQDDVLNKNDIARRLTAQSVERFADHGITTEMLHHTGKIQTGSLKMSFLGAQAWGAACSSIRTIEKLDEIESDGLRRVQVRLTTHGGWMATDPAPRILSIEDVRIGDSIGTRVVEADAADVQVQKAKYVQAAELLRDLVDDAGKVQISAAMSLACTKLNIKERTFKSGVQHAKDEALIETEGDFYVRGPALREDRT